MQQVLFRIPGIDFPVFGFGVMLFIAISVAAWLAGRRAERDGHAKRESLYDFVVWVVLGGLFGARLCYVIQYRNEFTNPFIEFFQIWDGGIVFYGSALGGLIAALIAQRRFLRQVQYLAVEAGGCCSPRRSPSGLCLGRIGCFLNGCCWGHVACPDRPAVHFPMMTTPAREYVSGLPDLGRVRDGRSAGTRTSAPSAPSSRIRRPPGRRTGARAT